MRSPARTISLDESGAGAKAGRVVALRQAIGKRYPASVWMGPATRPIEIPSLAGGLPGPGFPYGVLNEVIAPYEDRAAAFGFLFAVAAIALQLRAGPVLLVATQHVRDIGLPYGHGLRQFGVDAGRLILIDTKTDKDALWAIEQALRSGTRPAVVAGILKRGPGLTQSRRLNLAAAAHATPLVLSGCAKASGASAAATRWRIASAPAALDRFGMLAHWRWHATLERCRNGRIGEWLIEWDSAALRFRMVENVPHRHVLQTMAG
jgi:protein ImuA